MSVSIDATDSAPGAVPAPAEIADDRALTAAMVNPVARESSHDRRFAEIQALAQVGSWELDPSSERAIWSDELCRILGHPVGHAPSWEQFLASVHPDDRALVTTVFAGTREEGEAGAVYRILRPDGEIRFVHTLRQALPDQGGRGDLGQPIGLAGPRSARTAAALHQPDRGHQRAQAGAGPPAAG